MVSEWPKYNTPEQIMEACGLKDPDMNLPHPCLDCGRQQVWVGGKHRQFPTPFCPSCRLKELRELRKVTTGRSADK